MKTTFTLLSAPFSLYCMSCKHLPSQFGFHLSDGLHRLFYVGENHTNSNAYNGNVQINSTELNFFSFCITVKKITSKYDVSSWHRGMYSACDLITEWQSFSAFIAKVTKSGRASYFVSYMRESFKRMKLPKYCLPKVSNRNNNYILKVFDI